MYGFPEERDEWYGEMSDLLPLLHHLEPPLGLKRLWYARFSVYHEEQQRYGLRLVPREVYNYVYQLPPELIGDIAFSFEDENGSQRHLGEGPGFKALEEKWRQWYDVWTQDSGSKPVFLQVLSSPGDPQKILYDTRACARETTVILTDLEAGILECCDRVCTLRQIEEYCARCGHHRSEAVSKAMENLLWRKALLHRDGSYLSLTANPPRRAYVPLSDFPGGYYYPESEPAFEKPAHRVSEIP